MIQRRIFQAASFALLLALPQSINAGISLDETLVGLPIDQVIVQSRYDVVVAVIEKVDDKGATNGKPPTLVVRVTEVLRGDPKVDRRRAVWLPRPHDIDYGVVRTNPRYIQWTKKPLKGPIAGASMILLGSSSKQAGSGSFGISIAGRFELTKKNRDLAAAGIKRAEEIRRQRAKKLQSVK